MTFKPTSDYPVEVNEAINRAVDMFNERGCLQDHMENELRAVGYVIAPAQPAPDAAMVEARSPAICPKEICRDHGKCMYLHYHRCPVRAAGQEVG